MKKLALPLFALVAMMFCVIVPASAATTWEPTFAAGSTVYIDPAMKSRANFSDDFATQLEQKAQAHGLHVIVIAEQAGDELTGDRSNWASSKLVDGPNSLWNRALAGTGLDQDHTLMLLYIRAKDSNNGSIAARAGDYLHGVGLDQAAFADANGPVVSAARQFMKTDPQTGFLTVVDNINGKIDAAQIPPPPTDRTSADASGSDSGIGWWWLLIIGGPLVIIVAIVMHNRRESRRSFYGPGTGNIMDRAQSSQKPPYERAPSMPTTRPHTPPPPAKHTSSRTPSRPARSTGGGRRSGGGPVFIPVPMGGGHHGSGSSCSSSRSSCSSSSSSSSCSSSSSSSSSCGGSSSSSSSCGGSSSSCGGGSSC